jgi:serine/threonine-protein kinase
MPLILKNQYLPIKELPGGGFGITYIGLDLHSPGRTLTEKKRRVIKQLHPRIPLSKEGLATAQRLFYREAEALDNLVDSLKNQDVYPRIPQLYAFLELSVPADRRYYNTIPKNQQKFFYLVQEYIEGEDLSQELKQRQERGEKFSETEVLGIFKQILEILKLIHLQGVIHRDIKPSNIMRRRQDGKLYLIDFGAVKQVVKKVEEEASDSETVIVTKGFSPPEQENAKKVFPCSDLYSLAATCINLLTGENPANLGIIYDRESWRTKANISENFANILNRMLEANYQIRYQSADEVLAVLQSPTQELLEKKTELTDKSKPLLRKKWKFIAAFVGTASLLGATIYLLSPLLNKASLISDNYFTRGEESLININSLTNDIECQKAFDKKKEGMQAFKNNKLPEAKNKFQEAINLFKETAKNKASKCSVDPETQIFLNNTEANIKNNLKPLTIAVVIPVNTKEGYRKDSEQILRGVAHVQHNLNQTNGIKGQLLQVLISKDETDKDIAKIVAQHLADNNIPGDEAFQKFNSNILAVVGHFTSNTTLNAGEEYEKKELVAVSPTSTAVRRKQPIPNKSDYKFDLSRYVFRTSSTDNVAVEDLFRHAQNNKLVGEKSVVIFNSKSIYSRSLAEAFTEKFSPQTVTTCDLDLPPTQPTDCAQKAEGRKFVMVAVSSEAEADKGISAILATEGYLPLLGGDSMYTDRALQFKSSRNMVLAVPWSLDLASESGEFKTQLEELWRTTSVGWRTATTYDATQVIIQGLQNIQGELSRRALFIELKKDNFYAKGATGEVKFCPSGDRKIVPGIGVLVKIQPKPQEGQYFKLLETPNRTEQCS